MPEVMELKNPKALLLPPIQAMVKKFVAYDPAINPQEVLVELAYAIDDPRAGVFLAADEAGIFRGICVVYLPHSPFAPHPICPMLYAEGPGSIKKELVDKGVAFVKANNYDHIRAFNVSGKPDKVWLKSFKQAGTPTPVGTLVEFKFDG